MSSLLTSIGGVFGQTQQENEPEMASRAVVHQNQLRGEVKQKNAMGDARTRRVLKDIGNLAIANPAALGKKQISEVVDAALAENGVVSGKGHGVAKGAGAGGRRKVPENPKPESVIVVSSDETEKTRKPVSRNMLAAGNSTKEVKKAFTSTLSARSKAACGLSNKPKDPVVDIDADDVDDELSVTEYIDDIYKFYKQSEDEGRVHDYMGSQPQINAKMRSILVDWLIDVHHKFELVPETLYLTINIMDKFLSLMSISKMELQLVGISSMLIACKYEEIWAPEVNDFVCISDNAYVRQQVLAMEKAILEKLEWYLTIPTPYVFLVRFIKASLPSDKEMENMAFFLAELGLMQYPTVIQYRPSIIAASAVYAARCTLHKTPFWTETLKHHTGYHEYQLKGCAKLLVKFHLAANANSSKLKAAVYRKFSCPDRGAVALFSPAKSLSS